MFNRPVAPASCTLGHHVNVIPRGITIFGRLAIARGVSCFYSLCIPGGASHTPLIRRTVRFINLRSFHGFQPNGLSNNLLQQLGVTYNVTRGPSLVFFSRPAITISPRDHGTVLRNVRQLGRTNTAIVCADRCVRRIRRVYSHVLVVSRNQRLTLKATSRLGGVVSANRHVAVRALSLTSSTVTRIHTLPYIVRTACSNGRLSIQYHHNRRGLASILSTIGHSNTGVNRLADHPPALGSMFLRLANGTLESWRSYPH